MKRTEDAILESVLGNYPELADKFEISLTTKSLTNTSDIAQCDASGDYRYLAFVSYSHANEDWGKWIHKSLESFRIPSKLAGNTNQYGVVPKKAYPIFRDRDELSASAELSDVIQEALEDTRFLLVICSRESAKSHWVNQEIKLFKSFAGSKRVLCLIVDGEPHAKNADDECFPEAVKYEVNREGELTDIPCEPMAADARPQGDGKFNAKLKILSTLLGVRYDDLRQREKIRLRRKRTVSAITATLLFAITITSFLVYRQRSINERNQQIVSNLVDTLIDGSIPQSAETIERMVAYRDWAEDELLTRYQVAKDGTSEKYRLGLGGLEFNPVPLDYLRDQSLSLNVGDLPTVIETFKPFAPQLTEYYLKLAQDNSLPTEQRFIATCFLANLAPNDSLWNQEHITEFITDQILSVEPTEIDSTKLVFKPQQDLLIDSLIAAYGDQSQSDIYRLFAKSYLLDYCKDSPEKLFESLALSPPEYFDDFFLLLASFKDAAIQQGMANLEPEIPESESDEMVIRRQANIGLMLIKLGEQDRVWPVLENSLNPSVRTQLIHLIPTRGISAELLFDQYRKDTREDVRHCLLLTLGEYDEQQLSTEDRKRYAEILLQDYVTVKDSGTHGALDWLLRQWGFVSEIDELDKSLAGKPHEDRSWYVNGQGQTFAIITGEVFQKGAPTWHPNRVNLPALSRAQHKVLIDRVFFVGTKEISEANWSAYTIAIREQTSEAAGDNTIASPNDRSDLPAVNISWCEAARYCNWLSEQEGIPKSQWCFQPNSEGKYAVGMKAKENFLELDGYRLLTDSEWEFTCRAGTRSVYFHGNSTKFATGYVTIPQISDSREWALNADYRLSLPKPNGWGIAGMCTGANELVYDEWFDVSAARDIKRNYDPLGQQVWIDKPHTLPVDEVEGRRTRDWYNNRLADAGSAFAPVGPTAMGSDGSIGFRLARTIRKRLPPINR